MLTETTDRPLAARVMEEGAGWTRVVYDPVLDAWIGVPPFPEGDVWGSAQYLPDVKAEEAVAGWSVGFQDTPTFSAVGATEGEAVAALIAKMQAFRSADTSHAKEGPTNG